MTSPPLVLGVDIGGTRTKVGLLAMPEARILVLANRPTVLRGMDELLEDLDDALWALCHKAGADRAAVVAAGIGLPGCVLGDEVSLLWPSMRFLEGNGFRPAAQARLGLPVRMDNDARLIALAEAVVGAGGRARRLLSLTLGTGIGVGLVVDGALQEKSAINHMAGHILIHPGTHPCYCGLSGCLESLVSGPALVERYSALQAGQLGSLQPETLVVPVAVRAILDAAASGHAVATRAVQEMLDDLALGLSVYVNLYAPDMIVLGGGLARGLRRYLFVLRRGLLTHPFAGYRVALHLSRLGERAGIHGAASLWRELGP
jgi:glucokinase